MALDQTASKTETLHPDFGVKVTGVDMTTRTAELVDEVRGLIDRYSFVWFPDQSFDDDKQLDLTKDLGPPEPAHVARGEGRLEYHGTIGNVQPDGTVLGNSAQKTKFLTGNNMWHSDASFKPVPAYASIMCAYETPAEGGETLFVSTRAAWKRLSPERQAALDPLIAIHDYTFSRSKVAEVSAELSATLPPVRQRLVRTNPANGERNLFLGSHVREIEGMEAGEGRALLDRLVDETVAEPHVYAHKWSPGDLVIWDNRCLLHRGAGYDADKYRRYMRQTRVSGACSTLEE
jgi:alpha-ketoglutarate-dependent 2,4-dichlorophenoxyacetate dioxygenase